NILKSQEETLVDALAKITSVSEGESLEAGNSHEPSMGIEQDDTRLEYLRGYFLASIR
ncbi:hypothetical protein MKW92_028420, partial [Papaver armeniacum]